MESRSIQIDCPSKDQTHRVGLALGEILFPGAVVALVGPLGAGKTWLSRAIAQGLGMPDPTQVTSPTFVLIHEYAARVPVYHFDAYRLKQLSEFEDLGALEYFSGEGVCLVEWADRIEQLLPMEHLRVEITMTGPDGRLLTITGTGTQYGALVDQLSKASFS